MSARMRARPFVTLPAAAAWVLLSTGCATVVNETTQPIKVETQREDGSAVTGAECRLTNDYGTITMRSGDTAQVRRSGADLDVVCRDPAQPDATARLISRANAGMVGNIIFGGGIGAIIDHNKGTAYTYPTWVRLTFGRTLVFDRTQQKEGQMMTGVAPEAAKP